MVPNTPVIEKDLVLFKKTSFSGMSLLGPLYKEIKANGTGPTINARVMCVIKDADTFELKASYKTSSFPVPGMGTITINQLNADQIENCVLANNIPVMVVGSKFIAQFKVDTPATNPNGTPDPIPIYMGSGIFKNIDTPGTFIKPSNPEPPLNNDLPYESSSEEESLLLTICQIKFQSFKDDSQYLDRVNANTISKELEKKSIGKSLPVIVYHYTGARLLNGFQYKELDYQKKPDRIAYKKERVAFDSSIRKKWVKHIAKNNKEELIQAGISETEIKSMLKYSKNPEGYQVHHRIPLDDGGTNDYKNFILIRDDCGHRAVHGEYNPMELRIKLLKPGESAKVAAPIPPEDTIIYPNESKNYPSKTVENSKFMEQFYEI